MRASRSPASACTSTARTESGDPSERSTSSADLVHDGHDVVLGEPIERANGGDRELDALLALGLLADQDLELVRRLLAGLDPGPDTGDRVLVLLAVLVPFLAE